jgi:hypothetical protein
MCRKEGLCPSSGDINRLMMMNAKCDGLIVIKVLQKGICKRPLSTGTKPRNWAMLPVGDELAMEKALATIGPLAVAVNASPFTFQLYR